LDFYLACPRAATDYPAEQIYRYSRRRTSAPAPACLDGSANLIFTVDNGHSHSVTNNNVARSPDV
jgi:hypothetical protein